MKKYFKIFLVIFLMFTLSGCSAANKQLAPTKTKSLGTLTIGIMPDVDSVPLVIAAQKGYFDKEGLKVELSHFNSARDRDAALQAGKLDGAVSDILAAAFAKEGGFDVKITSMTDGSYKLLVGKTSGVTKAEDLKGKDIAVSTNTIIEYTTDRILKEMGLLPTDIKKVAIPQIPVRLEMLQNGKLTAATLPEPLASEAVKNGARVLQSTDQLKINPGVILFTSKTISEKSTELKAFYKSYNEAIAYLQKEPLTSYMALLVKENSFPEDVKDSVQMPKYNNAALPSKKDFTDVIAWQVQKSLIKTTFKYEDLVDSTFVR
jgi:NitT/TauT family transport system substrate-binding protein